MDEIWKTFQTVAFIAAGYANPIPPGTLSFNDLNRKAFHSHLEELEGVDNQAILWLQHLRQVNYYCDQKQIILLPEEKNDLTSVYNKNTDTNVHIAVDQEQEIFQKSVDKFRENTLNYNLRKYRFGGCFLPNGKIRFKAKKVNK